MNKEYYLGLDIGTDSVGYAVTDTEYKLLKHHGEPEWGAHIFDGGKDCADRRLYRTARRRIERRKQRICLLQELFAKEIGKLDESFFIRIRESRLKSYDAQEPKGVFIGDVLNDKIYNKMYPTIHHLICHLMEDKSPNDVRLVYLAVAWLVGHRGHFLSNVSMDNIKNLIKPEFAYKELMDFFPDEKPWGEVNENELFEILSANKGVNNKKETLSEFLYGKKKASGVLTDDFQYSREGIIFLLCGGKYKANKLFGNENYTSGISLKNSDDAEMEQLFAEIGDDSELIVRLKALYDCIALKNILNGKELISERKIEIYEQHRKDLYGDADKQFIGLKKFIKKYAPDKYGEVFNPQSAELANYAAYSGDKDANRKVNSNEEFCMYIRKILQDIKPDESDAAFYEDMMSRTQGDILPFLPKQVNSDNRLIPYQLYYLELERILDNASEYLPFLREDDENGISVQDKIKKIFMFRVPYFVGPLNRESPYAWFVRKPQAEGKIYPWNIENIIDYDASENEFIKRMTNKCTYIPGADVLPKMSLLYEKFEVLNEINNIKIGENRIPTELKQKLYNELFMNRKRVTPKAIDGYLTSIGCKDKVTAGLDVSIKSSLASHLAFKRLLNGGNLSESDVEGIILHSTCTEDSGRFKKWLKINFPQLVDEDIKYISNIKCKDFGRLSGELLSGIRGTCVENNEENTVIGFMWNYGYNLSEILKSDKFTFRQQLEDMQMEFYREHPTTLSSRLDDMYVSNAVKRSIYRTFDIIDDVVKANGGQPPKRVFVEMARGGKESDKGKRTLSRYEQLRDLYKKVQDKDAPELFEEMKSLGKDENEINTRLQSDKLFLYYTQLGRCMYSEPGKDRLTLDDVYNGACNIEHIYPQSKVKDDSIINNLVLVRSEKNGEKEDKYPIGEEIRAKKTGFWKMLLDNKLISDEKFKRLTRNTGFTDDEKWGFINRQIVETRQSTKVVTELLKERFPESEIVYVKAGLVSDFRNQFKMLKVRNVNDLHHAKDAYLNIVVGDVYHSKFTRQWVLNDANSNYSIKTETLFKHGVYAGKRKIWYGEQSIEMVRNVLRKNNAHFTKYAFCSKGGFFDQMPVNKGSNLIPLKNGLSVEDYGGYNKPAISFFALAAYTLGKKKQAMIVPIRLLDSAQCDRSEDDARRIIEQSIRQLVTKPISNLTLPLGTRKLKIGTMLEADGFRMCISGKGGIKKISLSPMMPLIASSDCEMYIKRLAEYDRKLSINPKYGYSKDWDKISVEDNMKLYLLLEEKAGSRPYCLRPGMPSNEKMHDEEQKFSELTLKNQVKTLLQLISLFGRSATTGKDIDMGCGACTLSLKISNWVKYYREVCIVDTSASGIYEKRSFNLLELVR